MDRNIRYQQSLRDRQVAVVILEGRTTSLDDLLPLIPGLLIALDALSPGEVVCIRND